MSSILYPWVERLGLRHQGVLVSAIRGCDSVPKHDPSKALVRVLRNEILRCHCGDPAKACSFIESVGPEETRRRMDAVVCSFDHYPAHFIQHLMHAAEIVGYKHGNQGTGWLDFYRRMCKKLHVVPESEEQLDARLNADEATFAVLQEKT